MKKILTLLTAMVCVFCLSACAVEQEELKPLISEEEAIQNADGIVSAMDEIYSLGLLEQYKEDPEIRSMVQPWLIPAIESWVAASEDMGDFVSITGHSVTYSSEDDMVIKTFVQGSLRNAEVEIVVEDGMTKSVAVNVFYSFEEQMQKAGLNTLLGMGTVFTILILISIIISLFVYIPKIQAAFSKKPEPATAKPAAAALAKPEAAPKAPAPAPAVAATPGTPDDPALLAVIGAAIAAYESGAPVPAGCIINENVDTGDSYVVRSIRRVSRR